MDTMRKKRCGDENPPCDDDDLIPKILAWLPVVSLMRFKSVSKSWCTLIESPSFIGLHTPVVTNFNSSNSSSNKFGSFILHSSVQFQNFRENALLRVSSVSESECVSAAVSWCSGSCGIWDTGFNGICGRCARGFGRHCRAWWWSTNDDARCGYCSKPYKVAEKDDQVLMLDNNLRGGGLGGGGGGSYSDGDESDDDDDQLVLKFDNLGFPPFYNFGISRPIDMVGSCNGLICLHDSERSDVSLWNPVTRQFRILPKPITIDVGVVVDDCLLHRLFAFGFDAETKDYNVVLVSVFIPVVAKMGCLCRVQVYSLSTDSWRLLEGINLLPGSPFPCTDSSSIALYLNGSCFFIARFHYPEQCIPENIPGYNDRFIISLDLTKEIIIPIQLPNHDRDMQLYLSYLGKKIALSIAGPCRHVNDTNVGQHKLFMILVLNEDGSRSSSSSSSRYVNKESWFDFHWFDSKFEGEIPRVISNDGVYALVETGIRGLGNEKKKKMTLYNLVTEKVKKNFIFCDQVLSKAYAYKPTLVSITSETAYKKNV